jgi:mannose/cellobiose epimerase-like protein (N-acyl-D-glucosamine 2-epimerase family)
MCADNGRRFIAEKDGSLRELEDEDWEPVRQAEPEEGR